MASILVVLFLLFSIAFAIFFVAATIHNRRRQLDEKWQRVAREFGLEFFAGSWTSGPAMAGKVNGFFVSVDTQGANEDRVTRYSVSYPSSAQQDIGLTKQSSFHFTLVKRLMSKNDVEIGDRQFDDRVLIDATDPIEAARYLSPIRRQAVLRLFAHQPFRDQKVTETSVVVDTLGVESDPVNLRATISALLDTAAIMSAPTDVDLAVQKVEKSLPPQDEVAPDAPPPQDRVAMEPESAPKPIDVPIVPEAEPDVEPVEPEVPAVQAAEPSTRTPPSLDQHAVITDLFESGRMGFETDEQFAGTYAGVVVSWSGEVDTVRDFRNDSDFEGVGIKATVLVGSVDQSGMRSRIAKAVVQLPEGTDVERGQHVEFEGTLLRSDRFTRQIYVADGMIHA